MRPRESVPLPGPSLLGTFFWIWDRGRGLLFDCDTMSRIFTSDFERCRFSDQGRPEIRRSELGSSSELQLLARAPTVARRLHFCATMNDSKTHAAATAINPAALRVLTGAQRAWCRKNGIAIATGERWGFYFSRDGRWLEPVPAIAGARVHMMAADDHEDGDGETLVASFDNMRAALAALAA